MRNLLITSLFSLLTILPATSFSQTKKGFYNLIGKLVDKQEKEPVGNASIQVYKLPDSTFVKGTTSNEKGNFKIRLKKDEAYCIKLGYLGYESRIIHIKRTDKDLYDLKDIELSPLSTNLKAFGINGANKSSFAFSFITFCNPTPQAA